VLSDPDEARHGGHGHGGDAAAGSVRRVADPIRRRATSRVLLFDESDALLLFLTYGVSHDVPPRWITPGGGLEPGEDFREAGERELFEETGLRATLSEPLRVVEAAVERRWHPYDIGHWAWFAHRAPRFEPTDAGWMDDERDDIVRWRWWTLEELERERPEVEPADLLDLVLAGLAALA
jgi:ADP-ribose pyrophosphatase YjhB (NUDIX family)